MYEISKYLIRFMYTMVLTILSDLALFLSHLGLHFLKQIRLKIELILIE